MFRSRDTHLAALLFSGVLVAAGGCSQDMADQPRYEPLESSTFFANGMASRPLVKGTVARGHLRVDAEYFEGTADGKPITTFPLQTVAEAMELSGDNSQLIEKILARGQERFSIFCSPCHGLAGEGDGMVVKRGFPAPPSFHTERLRDAPVGHVFDVATRGFGRMPSYASQIPTADRWSIVAYVRALQLSQFAEARRLPEEDRARLQEQLRER
jgi:mono/diheme cytochrome c family protein